jgi:hypothetical protein
VCAANATPSSYYLYSIFNLGFNTIVFLVNLAIVFLLMGAFMWLVVAYAANQAIKYGVRWALQAAAGRLGVEAWEQLLALMRCGWWGTGAVLCVQPELPGRCPSHALPSAAAPSTPSPPLPQGRREPRHLAPRAAAQRDPEPDDCRHAVRPDD